MSDKTYIYLYSFNEAKEYGELDDYKKSYKLNIECAKTIKKAIIKINKEANKKNNERNLNGNTMNRKTAKKFIAEFGYDRVNYVLANTVQRLKSKGEFSTENKEWAKEVLVLLNKEDDGKDRRSNFIVKSNTTILECLIGLVRKEYQSLNLWENKHCNKITEPEIISKVMVIHPTLLSDEYKNRREQLIYCQHGFSCRSTARGLDVIGTYLDDGRVTHYNRSHFIGELKAEYIPQWVHEKLAEMGIVSEHIEIKQKQLLNLILDSLDEQGQEDFNVLCENRENQLTASVINVALSVKDQMYNIYRGITDETEIGKRYMKEENAHVTESISNATFASIGNKLINGCGRITGLGFVLNYEELPRLTYEITKIDSLLAKYGSKQQQSRGEVKKDKFENAKALYELNKGTDTGNGYGCVYLTKDGGNCTKYQFDLTPKNISNFLGKFMDEADRIILSDIGDNLVCDFEHGFIVNFPDKELLKDVLPYLTPIQMGENIAEDIVMATIWEVNDYEKEMEYQGGMTMN